MGHRWAEFKPFVRRWQDEVPPAHQPGGKGHLRRFCLPAGGNPRSFDDGEKAGQTATPLSKVSWLNDYEVMNNSRNPISRRDFLKSGVLAAGALNLMPSGVLGQAGRAGANARFVVANIGVGGMGMTHLANMLRFQKEDKVRVAAVCDVDDNRLEAAVENAGPGVKPYRDYRYILERKDIDAVLIATPDHWHAVQTVHACQTGKHVYVEKPASVTVREGQAMVAAARANKVAVQVGAQARTAKGAWYTCRAIRNGIVGKVKKVTCWHYANPVDEKPVPDSPPPEGLDWDMWLGPLPWRAAQSCGINPATSAGSSNPAAARFATAAPTSSARFSGA